VVDRNKSVGRHSLPGSAYWRRMNAIEAWYQGDFVALTCSNDDCDWLP